IQLGCLPGLVEEVEVVELRAARARLRRAPRRLLRPRTRKRDAEELAVRRLVDLVPELSAMPLDDLLQRERACLAADLQRIGLPGHRRLGAARRTGPDEVEMRERPLRRESEAELADGEFVGEPAREIGDRLHQRVAVDLYPHGLIDRLELGQE